MSKTHWTLDDDAKLRRLMPEALELAGSLRKAAAVIKEDFPGRSVHGIISHWRFLQMQDEEKELAYQSDNPTHQAAGAASLAKAATGSNPPIPAIIDGRNPEEVLLDQLREAASWLRRTVDGRMERIHELEAENAELRKLIDGIVNFKRKFGYTVDEKLNVEFKKESDQ